MSKKIGHHFEFWLLFRGVTERVAKGGNYGKSIDIFNFYWRCLCKWHSAHCTDDGQLKASKHCTHEWPDIHVEEKNTTGLSVLSIFIAFTAWIFNISFDKLICAWNRVDLRFTKLNAQLSGLRDWHQKVLNLDPTYQIWHAHLDEVHGCGR